MVDRACVRALYACEKIEQRRLAGAVWTDDAGDLPLVEAEGAVVYSPPKARAMPLTRSTSVDSVLCGGAGAFCTGVGAFCTGTGAPPAVARTAEAPGTRRLRILRRSGIRP